MRYKILGKSGLRVSMLCLGTMTFGEEWGWGASKDESKRLDTEYIDLLWVHAWDPMTPVEEFMRALDDLVSAGKVFYVGISDAPAWIVAQANTLAKLRGWSPLVGIQIKYSLLDRTPERDLLPMAQAFDIGVTAWSPLGGGVLTGKYNQEIHDPKRYAPEDPFGKMMLNERNLSIAAKIQQIAGDIGRTPSQVALRWLVQQNDRGVIIPIIGARSKNQFTDNLGCLDFELEARHLEEIENVSKIELGFPHDFLKHEEVRSTVYGNTLSLIDNHRT